MKRPKLAIGVVRKVLPGDEEVLTTPDGANAVILNTMAAVIVDLCDGKRTLDDITDFIATNVAETERATVRRDVVRLIDQLKAAQILEAK